MGKPAATDRPRLTPLRHSFTLDAILCFHYREDAEKVKNVLSKRFAKYGLTLHPEKTRLLEFGRYAWNARRGRERRNPAPSTSLASRTFAHAAGEGSSQCMCERCASGSAGASRRSQNGARS